MRSYTIYRSSRTGVLECCAFQDGRMILHTSMVTDGSAPVLIDTANIRLKSDYDSDQTLIPGVTKRTVFYSGKSTCFAEIKWNRDETYTIDFTDEEVKAIRPDGNSFVFEQSDRTIGTIDKNPRGERPVIYEDVRYEPSYTVEYEEGISQQALIMMMVFPILYFGF